MTYTKTKPTTPGWYFYREGAKECVIRFGEDVGHGMFSEQGWGACLHVDKFDGDFAGPIPEPGLFSELAATAEVERAMGDKGTGSFADGIEYALKVLSGKL